MRTITMMKPHKLLFGLFLGAVALFAASSVSHAAITFDASSTAHVINSTIVTSNIQLGSNPSGNGILLVCVGQAVASAITNPLVNNTPSTLIATNTEVGLFYATLGNISGQTITVTTTVASSSNLTQGLFSFYSVNQSTPVDQSTSVAKITANPSSTIGVSANEFAVDCLRSAGTNVSLTPSGSQTAVANWVSSTPELGASYLPIAITGSTTTGWMLGSSQGADYVNATLEPAASAGTSTWIDASSTPSWSNPANWSPYGVPGPTSNVVFSASSSAPCSIDASVIVKSITMLSGAGTITQKSGNTVNVTNDFNQSAGTFSGSSNASDTITVGGNFSLTGGTFTSTAGILNIGNSFTKSGTFQHNSGTVLFSAMTGTASINGSSTFYNLFFVPSASYPSASNGTYTLGASTVLTVTSQLGLLGDASGAIASGVANSTLTLVSGEIDVLGTNGGANNDGAISFGASESGASGETTKIVMKGASPQMIDGGGFGNEILGTMGGGGNFTINASSGVPVYTTNDNDLRIYAPVAITSGEFRLASDTAPTTANITFGSTVYVASGAVFSSYPQTTTTVQFGLQVVNNGTVFFDGSTAVCALTPPKDLVLTSSSTTTWYGGGNFIMRYSSLTSQIANASITVNNGTNVSGNSGNWTFASTPRPQFIQSVSSSTGAGKSTVILPAFGFWPRAGDLMLVAVSAKNLSLNPPTDNAGNTYALVASTTYGGSPSYTLGLYYAKNINTTSSFVITASGTPGASYYISAAAFEYTGMAPSSTFDSNFSANSSSGATTTVTSLGATGGSSNELYFGLATLSASTTASAGSGWSSELAMTDNASHQSLYVEDMATTSIPTTAPAATWTTAAATNYDAIMGIFHSPFTQTYAASGTLDSATFDTGVASGSQINSVMWQGMAANGSYVAFQFATSSAPGGPWNYVGPNGANTYFPAGGSTLGGTPIGIVSNNGAFGSYSPFIGRYFRYRIFLFADPTYQYTPTVNQVVVNWSP